MGNGRLQKTVLKMLLFLDVNGKDLWASRISEILCETRFNFLKQRLVDLFIQEWSESIRDKDRYEMYRSQARFGVLPLNKHLHRYSV